ncbi:MAG: cyclophilin-like fold protein [Pleomorphochaeta sp.]
MKKRILISITTLFFVILAISCTSENTNKQVEIQETHQEKTIMENNQKTTPIILEMNGKIIHGTLNDTQSAQAFKELLPFSVTVSRAADDLCGSVSEDLPFDPTEGKKEWKIGEIGWFGGWFTILVDHEEQFKNMPNISIIGSIDKSDIETVKAFKNRIDIIIKIAK